MHKCSAAKFNTTRAAVGFEPIDKSLKGSGDGRLHGDYSVRCDSGEKNLSGERKAIKLNERKFLAP